MLLYKSFTITVIFRAVWEETFFGLASVLDNLLNLKHIFPDKFFELFGFLLDPLRLRVCLTLNVAVLLLIWILVHYL